MIRLHSLPLASRITALSVLVFAGPLRLTELARSRVTTQ